MDPSIVRTPEMGIYNIEPPIKVLEMRNPIFQLWKWGARMNKQIEPLIGTSQMWLHFSKLVCNYAVVQPTGSWHHYPRTVVELKGFNVLLVYSLYSPGKCYLAVNQKTLVQCLESISQKLHPGVVINFQKIGGCSPNSSLGPGSKDISRSNTPVAMEIGKQL